MNLPPLGNETRPRRHVLPNGSVLLTRMTPGSHGVSMGVWVRTGSRDEAPAQGGISHLLEHMVFKGTHRRSAFELSRDMEALGGHLDAFTTKEHTAYTIRVLPEQLGEALSILAEMLEHSTHPEDQLALEKEVVVEEILSSEDTPDDYVHERFMERLWPDHPLSRPILGTRETVQSISRDDLVRHMEQVHRGGNLVVAAAGAVGEREEQLLAEAFDFTPGHPEPGTLLEMPALPRPHPGRWTYPKDLGQLYLEIGIPAVGMNHPDRYAVVLLANLLGGGMSSRLFQKVREEQGLAYGIYTWTDFHADTGCFCTSLSSSPEKGPRALAVIAAEYQRLREGDLRDEEIEMNRNQVLASMVLGLEGSMHQASRQARSEIYYGRFVGVEEMIEQLHAVTRDDLVRVAESHLDPTLQTVVGYGPAHELVFG